MEFWKILIELLDTQMPRPEPYGWFHLLFFVLSIIGGILLCIFLKEGTEKQVRTVLLTVSITVILLEVYKQINYTFISNGETVVADFQWYSFPFQFCSMPMYAGLLAGVIKKGRVHDALCAFLATYSIFAGCCVMLYPVQVFIGTVGINIQTMVCHGSMISVGMYLLYTQYVKSEHKTILKALPVFCTAILTAMAMNEIAYLCGITEAETFNMFFISPHEDPSLPVYSAVQGIIPYPWCLLIYIAAFTLAAYIVLLISIGIKKITEKRRKIKI